MADYTDVQNALVALASGAIYPNGTGQPSVTGFATAIYPGWPNAQQLNSDLAALNAATGGRIHVTVFATSIERDVSRYWPSQTVSAAPATTVTATVASGQITFGGAVTTPQNIAVNVAGALYTYSVQVSDTLTSIATAIAALIPGATSAGAVVTVPGRILWVRVGTFGSVQTEQGRRARTFQLTIWAHTPAARAATASAIDQVLCGLPFITLADGTQGRMRYKGSPQDDVAQRDAVFRRDLNYEVEFAITTTASVPQTIAIGVNESATTNPALTAPSLTTRYT